MGLLSFFQRQDQAASEPDRKPRGAAPTATDAVQAARTRARQRLIGAVVLLGLGIVGFPLLFETQPRPIPVDIPIEIPRKDAAAPLQLPAAKPAPKPAASASAAVITETAADAGREVPAPASAPASAAPAPAPKAVAEKPAEKPVEKPVAVAPAPKPSAPAPHAAPAKTADEGARAKALLEGKPAAAEATAGRFIVQVGAFAEVSAARETRLRVEKLGLKTYTQVVETDAGRRIRVRVGPFPSRDEADKAAAKIKSAGLASAVLTL